MSVWTLCRPLAGLSLVRSGPDTTVEQLREQEQLSVQELYARRQLLSGWQRLQLMWMRNEESQAAGPELQFVQRLAFGAFFVGFTMGSVARSRQAFQDFMAANKHSIFADPQEAQAAVRRVMVVNMWRGGVSFALKASAMAAAFGLMMQSADCYRGVVSPLHDAIAAMSIGFLYRLPSGPVPAVMASMGGLVLGGVEGTLRWLVCKVSGEDLNERMLRQYQVIQKSSEEMKERRTWLREKFYAKRAIDIEQEDILNNDGEQSDEMRGQHSAKCETVDQEASSPDSK